jgi:hypothetical protein
MDEKLVEALAGRLKSENECAQCDMPLDWWKDLAWEVLRQMEWARREVEIEWAAIEGFPHPDKEIGKRLPLTLAPDDWTP